MKEVLIIGSLVSICILLWPQLRQVKPNFLKKIASLRCYILKTMSDESVFVGDNKP